jgi:hypothetical protein
MIHDLYEVTNISNELWNSSQAPRGRDKAGHAVKFSVPTISNGKVYVGTSTEVDVYGLGVVSAAAMPAISPESESVTTSVTVTITDATSGANIYYTIDGSTLLRLLEASLDKTEASTPCHRIIEPPTCHAARPR